jgi:basic membrane lipoprotein Med (substrate-binding protein (PBP1-ABC) superfamily)
MHSGRAVKARPVYFGEMRMRAALIALAVLCAGTGAGCGSAPNTTTTVTAKRVAVRPPPAGLKVGVVGPLEVSRVPGASITSPRSLARMPAYPLVVVSSGTTSLAAVEAAALRYPTSHYAYVGGSTKGHRHANLVGLVLNDAEAAQLGGTVAGLAASEEGGSTARVAWVGPRNEALAAAFARGVQGVRPGTTVLRVWSTDVPASCKEAALGAVARGAVVVMGRRGLCAEAAIAGAHQQNRVGLQLSDFELTRVPVGVLIADAVAGVFRGGEDIVFGASSGAIGVRHLDPRISPDLAVRARAAAQQLSGGLRASG